MASSFNPNCLANQVAVITGGGSGICMGIARVFMKHGADVAILSRNYEKLKKASEELEADTKQSCFPVAADVRNYDQMSEAFDKIMNRFGSFNILVNGAAGNFLSPVASLSYNGFKSVMEIDAHGTFIASQLAYKKALKEKGGVILNISMTLHYTGTPFQTHAGAAKSAVDAMTKHMAVEFGPKKVRVNGVAPGPIGGTVGMDKLGGKMSPKQIAKGIPLGKMGTVDDIGYTCMFLCLKEASFITGTTVVVDGGEWLGGGGMLRSLM
nr:2,4-dienoyl-CoA reductase 2 [Nephromyces sp. MMRI]AZL94581.1 2,4-dienoyl-CoA reductase 2 [Nephromyces sp. MMRI]